MRSNVANKIPNTNIMCETSKNQSLRDTKKNKPAQLEYVTKAKILRVCEEIVNWAWKQTELPKEERDLVTIQTYLNENRIHLSTWKRWLSENEELVNARNNAKAILGDMQLKLAASGKFNASPIMVILPGYNEEFREGKQLEADTKAKAIATQQQKVFGCAINTYALFEDNTVKPVEQKDVIPVSEVEKE